MDLSLTVEAVQQKVSIYIMLSLLGTPLPSLQHCEEKKHLLQLWPSGTPQVVGRGQLPQRQGELPQGQADQGGRGGHPQEQGEQTPRSHGHFCPLMVTPLPATITFAVIVARQRMISWVSTLCFIVAPVGFQCTSEPR